MDSEERQPSFPGIWISWGSPDPSRDIPFRDIETQLEDKVTDMTDNLAARTYNQPTDEGFEQHLRARFDEIRKLKSKSVSES